MSERIRPTKKELLDQMDTLRKEHDKAILDLTTQRMDALVKVDHMAQEVQEYRKRYVMVLSMVEDIGFDLMQKAKALIQKEAQDFQKQQQQQQQISS